MKYIKQLNTIFIMIILIFGSANPALAERFETDAIEFRMTELITTKAIMVTYESDVDLRSTITYTGGIGRDDGHTFMIFGYGTKYYFQKVFDGIYTGISLEFTTNKESPRYDLGVLGYEYVEIKKSVDLNVLGKLGKMQRLDDGYFFNYELDVILAAHLEDPRIYLGAYIGLGKIW